MYDGINRKNKALYAWNDSLNRPNAKVSLFMFTQSKEFKFNNHKPFLTHKGILCSLMLETDRNRFIYSVDKGNSNYTISINDYIESKKYPFRGKCHIVAKLKTPILFIKTVSLGANTYFGITDSGDLYSLWLKHKKIKFAKQKFSTCPHKFKDISVDNSTCTAKKFKPKVAFLTQKGEIYITHLNAFEQPTLLFVTTIKNADDVKRLYYNDGKLSIVYRNQQKLLTWQDNFESLYTYALLKKLYPNS